MIVTSIMTATLCVLLQQLKNQLAEVIAPIAIKLHVSKPKQQCCNMQSNKKI
jgi:hypothetical protein